VIGLLTLFSLLIDLILENMYLSESGIREPIWQAPWPTLTVGLPIWLISWRPLQAQATANDDTVIMLVVRSFASRICILLCLLAVIGGMVAAGTLVFELVNAALSNASSGILSNVLTELTALIVFVVVLVYHLLALRAKDGAARADILAEKQTQFHVVVFDQDGKFGEAVKASFAKRAPELCRSPF
jgi:hypothetical protein